VAIVRREVEGRYIVTEALDRRLLARRVVRRREVDDHPRIMGRLIA
jgi:hypothetical protein